MSERFTPSDLQAQAIREIKEWFLHRTAEQQVFRVFGYAGTGKTTITRHGIDELGLDTMARSADGMVSVPLDQPGIGVLVDVDRIDDLTLRREVVTS